jgi:hypothetical protein
VQMKAVIRSEQRITNLVDQLTRAIPGGNVTCVVQPSALPPAPDAKSQVAAAPGQIERKLGTITTFDPKRRMAAIKRSIERSVTVFDDEVAPLGPVAQRALDAGAQVRARACSHLRAGAWAIACPSLNHPATKTKSADPVALQPRACCLLAIINQYLIYSPLRGSTSRDARRSTPARR